MTIKEDCCQSRPPMWAVFLLSGLFFALGWFVRSTREDARNCARKVCPAGTTPRLQGSGAGCTPDVCVCPIPAKDPTP